MTTTETATRTVTQFAAVFNHSGTIWNTYPSREAAEAFIADMPDVGMHVARREADGDTHTRWVTA